RASTRLKAVPRQETRSKARESRNQKHKATLCAGLAFLCSGGVSILHSILHSNLQGIRPEDLKSERCSVEISALQISLSAAKKLRNSSTGGATGASGATRATRPKQIRISGVK